MPIFNVIQHALRKPKFRYSIAEHPADLIFPLENCYLVSIPRKDDRYGNSGGAGSYDRHPHAIRRRRPLLHLRRIGRGYIILNRRKMHRRTLTSQNAMPLALVFMVAHKAAHSCQRIVIKEQLSGLVQLFFLQQADHLRYWCVNGTPLPALGYFASEAAVGLIHHMQCHSEFLPFRPRTIHKTAQNRSVIKTCGPGDFSFYYIPPDRRSAIDCLVLFYVIVGL